MPAGRVCNVPGCPEPATVRGRCAVHGRAAEAARGTRQQRGYDADHDALRLRWVGRLRLTPVPCARCHELIHDGDEWDLGHPSDRPGAYAPEHARQCNRAAGGRAAHE